MISVNNTWQLELIIKSYPTIHTQNYKNFFKSKNLSKKIRKNFQNVLNFFNLPPILIKLKKSNEDPTFIT